MASSTVVLRAGAMFYYMATQMNEIAVEWGNRRIHSYHMDSISRARDGMGPVKLSDFVQIDELLQNVSTN